MEVKETKLKGCFLIKDNKFNDSRGYFFESFNQKRFNDLIGESIQFVQENQSRSTKGVLRGLHFQLGEFSQAKLVRVLEGRVLDVAVDIRPESFTFGEHVSFFYKCDNYYNKSSEGGIIFNDPEIGINWQLPKESLFLSSKDLELKFLKEITNKLVFQ